MSALPPEADTAAVFGKDRPRAESAISDNWINGLRWARSVSSRQTARMSRFRIVCEVTGFHMGVKTAALE